MKKGVALYIIIVVITIILAIVLGVTTILLKQIKITNEIQDSAKAYYAADLGIERVLGIINESGADALVDFYEGDIDGYSYEVEVVCCDPDEPTCLLGSGTGPITIDDLCVEGGSVNSCPPGLDPAGDSTCKGSGICIRSSGKYGFSNRAIEVGYNYRSTIEYDYFRCSEEQMGGTGTTEYIGRETMWGSVIVKRAQFLIANQDYFVSCIELPLFNYNNFTGNINIGIQKVDFGVIDDPEDDKPDGYIKNINGGDCFMTLDSTTDLPDGAAGGDPVWTLVELKDVSGNAPCLLKKDNTYAVIVEMEDPSMVVPPFAHIKWLYGIVSNSHPSCGITEVPCYGERVFHYQTGGDWTPRSECDTASPSGGGHRSLVFSLWQCPYED